MRKAKERKKEKVPKYSYKLNHDHAYSCCGKNCTDFRCMGEFIEFEHVRGHPIFKGWAYCYDCAKKKGVDVDMILLAE